MRRLPTCWLWTNEPAKNAGRWTVYLVSEAGEMVVMEAARQPKILARNQVEQRTLASPVISGGRLFIRTDENLYCIDE